MLAAAPADSTDWAAVLLQGTLASVISIVGLFVAYKLSARAEAAKLAAQRGWEEKCRLRARTATSVTRIVEASFKVRRCAPADLEAANDELFEALLLGAVTEAFEHSDASSWMSSCASALTTLHPDEEGVGMGKVARYRAGYLAGFLTA